MSENAKEVEEVVKGIKELRVKLYYLEEEAFNEKQKDIFETMIDLSFDFEKACRDFIYED